jgi:uncharacterized protein YndB with AHSA1/START domain
MSATAGDSAAATVYVAVSPADAFEIFTSEVDAWWRHGRKYRIAGARPGRLSFEAGLGGRLLEEVELGSGPRTFVVGTIIEWAPPARFAFEWRNVNFAPHQKTLVEVSFQPSGEGTLVRVEHSGWSSLPDDHPARHGKTGADFARQLGLWWGDLMSALREYVLTRPC